MIAINGTDVYDDPKIVEQAVHDAIDAGYRHFDCAYIYQNEKEIGKVLCEKIAKGIVKREDLFITTKLWNTFHKRDNVVPACRRSVKNFGLGYVDLYLIHWPISYAMSSRCLMDMMLSGQHHAMLSYCRQCKR
ncbi:PREDICTED: aldose reductase A-like [Trachymyrmex cornetzi]|uniref:aldose reductase A-like n=1 Tax=Trachymyrmex cornetzi TaxID=471704 RepID=UPI00084F0B0B|nr:PREDICTED: aldose reductase A-like [Trachymyrmex cornetzi]